MIKNVFIATLFFLGFLSFESYAQNAAQATMRVSVTVVSSSSVETKAPAMVNLSNESNVELGVINFKGLKEGEAFIESTDRIVLEDDKGNSTSMKISTTSNEQNGSNTLQLMGERAEKMISSVYRGELTTSVQYF